MRAHAKLAHLQYSKGIHKNAFYIHFYNSFIGYKSVHTLKQRSYGDWKIHWFYYSSLKKYPPYRLIQFKLPPYHMLIKQTNYILFTSSKKIRCSSIKASRKHTKYVFNFFNLKQVSYPIICDELIQRSINNFVSFDSLKLKSSHCKSIRYNVTEWYIVISIARCTV